MRDNSNKAHYFRRQEMKVLGDPVEADSKTLLAFVPHGILCCGWAVNGNCGVGLQNSGATWLGAASLFQLPLISDVLSWFHGGPASKANMLNLMKQNKNIALIPGGFEEATHYEYGKHISFVTVRIACLILFIKRISSNLSR